MLSRITREDLNPPTQAAGLGWGNTRLELGAVRIRIRIRLLERGSSM